MIYKIFDKKTKSYWLVEFDNKKDAVRYARKSIKQDYFDNADECIHPSVNKYVNEEIERLSFVKFTNKELNKQN